jgi:hypothetical protein
MKFEFEQSFGMDLCVNVSPEYRDIKFEFEQSIKMDLFFGLSR